MYKGSADEEVLSISLKESSILITEDKDFGELVYRLKKAHIGIILIRLSGLDPEMKNSFSVISYNQTRIRK